MNTIMRDGLIVSIGLLVAGSIGEYNSRNEPNRYELYKQVCAKADANKDGHQTEAEWIAAYDIMGVCYNARNPNPFLSVEQMQNYFNSK